MDCLLCLICFIFVFSLFFVFLFIKGCSRQVYLTDEEIEADIERSRNHD